MTDARIQITADAAQAEATLLRLGNVTQGLSSRFQGLAGMAGALGGALSITAFATLVKSAIDSADALNDLSKRTGASVEMLAGFRLAAEQSGTSLEGIANGTKKLATSMVENEVLFKKLGINTKSQSEALIQLGDVFAGMEDPVKRSALAVKIFGKSGDEMLPMLMEGSDGIRKMVERGQELSGVTTQMAQDADRFNDSLAELKLSSKNLYVGIAAELLPVLNESIEAFNGINKTSGATSIIANGLATTLETVVVVGSNVAYVFNSIGREVGGIVAQFSAMGEAGGIFSKEGRDAWTRVGEEMRADAEAARKDIDAFTERILTARQRARESAAKGPGDDGNKRDNRGNNLLAGLTGATDEAAKLRQKDIDGWVKYADAVLAEGERVDEVRRKQIEADNQAEQSRLDALKDLLAKGNQSLAEALGLGEQLEATSLARRRAAELDAMAQRQQDLQVGAANNLQEREDLAQQIQLVEQAIAAASTKAQRDQMQGEKARLDERLRDAQSNGQRILADQEELGRQRLQLQQRYGGAAAELRQRQLSEELAALEQRRAAAVAAGQAASQAQEEFERGRLQAQQRYAAAALADQARTQDLLAVDRITRQRATSLAVLDEQKRAAQAAGQLSAQAEEEFNRQRLDIKARADVEFLALGATSLAQAVENQKRSQTQRIIAERDADLAALEQRRQTLQAANQWSLDQETEYEQARLLIKVKAGAAVAKQVEDLQNANLSEEELQRNHLAQLQADLLAAREQGLITVQQYNDLLLQETIKSQAALGNAEAQGIRQRRQFEEMNARQKTQFLLGEMISMTRGVATTNRALFEINKVAGIAQATIDMYQGAQKTWNAYPYPLNIPMTALQVATSLANISAISSAEFGTSTSAPTIAGGAAIPVFNAGSSVSGALPAPNANIEPARQQINLTLVGKNMDFDTMVNEFIPLLQQASANGALDIQVTRG